MKKLTIIIGIAIGILSCSTSKTSSDKGSGIGIRQKTSNPNTPYIYKNGYRDFVIIPISTINRTDSIYINELRFNAVYSAMYTKKLMFDKFGKWDKEIRPNNDRHPILLWKNIKLFDDENKTYSVAASGVESWNEMYASVKVFDNTNTDCLTDDYYKKDSIVKFFSDGIINLSSDRKFYDAYWKMVNEVKN